MKKIKSKKKIPDKKISSQKNSELKIKISACYIVKNNAEDLKISLQSLKDFVDEIIVIDTGSTDDTVEVSKNFGAKVFFKAWQDDFSAARNFALEKSSGDWIIFLDADEFFSAQTAKNIPFVIERAAQFNQNAVQVFLINIDKDDGNKIQDTNYVVRIMKKISELHYVGKIHEELRLGENILSNVVTCPPEVLQIYHTGYSTSLNKDKAARNLKMLLEELKETSEPKRIYHYIAECYKGLEDFGNAEKFANLSIESNSSKKLESYNLLLSILAHNKKRIADREKLASKAVEDFPNLPEFSAELAECFAYRDDFQKAVETMSQALKKFQNCLDKKIPTQFDEGAKNFAESRIKFWIELIIQNQYPNFDSELSTCRIIDGNIFLMEENDEKN